MFEARSRGSRIVLQIVAIVFVFPFAFPLIAMVQGSFAGEGWRNYSTVLAVPGFVLFFRNSAIIAGGDILIVYACSMLAGYGFSKLRIRSKGLFFWMLLACLTLPEVVLLTPLFVTATKLGFYNTYWSIILPLAALQIPFCVVLAREFISGIPEGIFEAAKVDGAGSVRVFLSVVVPLTAPIAVTIVILTLIQGWNDYLLPLVFLESPSRETITLIPSYFLGEFSDDQTKVLAAAVITALPEIIAYVSLQKFFERGLASGAVK